MDFSEVQLPTNKRFGYFFTLVFFISSSYFWIFKNLFLTILFFVLAAFFLVITISKPQILRPLNKTWMWIGFLLGKIVSPIIVGLIFFILFTPMSLSMRLFGRDELKLKLKKMDSYWIKNDPQDQASSFKNQF